jgi:hypothetical protein
MRYLYFADEVYQFGVSLVLPFQYLVFCPPAIGAATYPKKPSHIPDGIPSLVLFHGPVHQPEAINNANY